MSRISVFSAPFLLGFDAFEERVDRMAKAAETYPPYNIERVCHAPSDQNGAESKQDETYIITIAVAGFSTDDLAVVAEDNQIVVRGKIAANAERDFLHRGIATRQFQRNFLLADQMVIQGAELKDGMLTITVLRPQPEKRVQTIEIVQK